MSNLFECLSVINTDASIDKKVIIDSVIGCINASNYSMTEMNIDEPWGGYFRFPDEQADAFVKEFYPGVSFAEARLNHRDVELSPKILVICPGKRLSLQYHNHRAELWRFITPGKYEKTMGDTDTKPIRAESGDVVHILPNERHRLIEYPESYMIVAEIWQHTDHDMPSSEVDIVRLQDDFGRS